MLLDISNGFERAQSENLGMKRKQERAWFTPSKHGVFISRKFGMNEEKTALPVDQQRGS